MYKSIFLIQKKELRIIEIFKIIKKRLSEVSLNNYNINMNFI